MRPFSQRSASDVSPHLNPPRASLQAPAAAFPCPCTRLPVASFPATRLPDSRPSLLVSPLPAAHSPTAPPPRRPRRRFLAFFVKICYTIQVKAKRARPSL